MKSNELIRRYLLGIASDEEVHELERRLLVDEELQDEFLLKAELDAHLRQEAQLGLTESSQPVAATHVPTTTDSKVDSRRLQTTNRVLLAVAVVALVVVCSQAFLFREHREEIITITSLSGPVAWTGAGGRVTNNLVVGEKLSVGTMELLAPDSWVEFAFQDQSTVTLTGLTAITITAAQDEAPTQQEELHLRHGHLSASVPQQPTGHPMLVRTPSAELTVLGTQFDVETVSESTRLTVNEGRVRLKRLTDGKEVDVPAQQTVLASLEDQSGLSPRTRNTPVTVWRSDLREDVVKGKWVSRLWTLGGKLKLAVANGEMTRNAALKAYKSAAHFDDSTGSVWAAPSPTGSLILLSPRRSMEQPVLLNASTLIRVRVQAYSQAAVRIGLTVRHPDGGFAGKFSTRVSTEELTVGDRAVEIELPISRFHDKMTPAGSPLGNELVDWWCAAETSSAKVEITGVEVLDTPKREKP